MNKSGQWTIYDIAREAGVSTKTVSRVLNGKDGVGPATRERILAIMKRTGYHPHMGARALRGESRGCIGVTVPAPPHEVPISEAMLLWLFSTLLRVFGPRGEYISFDLYPHEAPMSPDYGRGLWEQLFRACVVAGPLKTGDEVIRRIHDAGHPYVALSRLDGMPEVSSATVDYEQGAYLSTKFLLDRGHTCIAMLRAFPGFQPSVERTRGYRHALEEAGIPFDDGLVRSVDFGARRIADIVHHLLSDPNVTALIDCSATEDATSLRDGARRAGRTPGQNFEIVDWTYINDAAVLHEACAHVWLPVREVATEGLEWLSDWVQGEREGPVKLLYQPVLSETVSKGEVPKPRRIFDTLE